MISNGRMVVYVVFQTAEMINQQWFEAEETLQIWNSQTSGLPARKANLISHWLFE